jgi:hypothetical protein
MRYQVRILSVILFFLCLGLLPQLNSFAQENNNSLPDSLLDGRWMYTDVLYESVQYDNDPNAKQRERVREPLHSIVIDSRTMLRSGPGQKQQKFGYIKFVDSSHAEYARRCCWEGKEERKYRVDSLTDNYLRLVKVNKSYHPGYDPQDDYDSPLPKGEKQPGFNTVERNVVILKRITDR